MIAVEIISKKRSGHVLSQEEIDFFISQFAADVIPEYQMAALLMAIYFKGMNSEETYFLTNAMMRSGNFLDFSDLDFPTVDKHSTGGVGDKTSLILGPIVASFNIGVPMIAGRGLGHTGGTVDKLESIPGFNCHLSLEKFKNQIATNYLSIIAQTPEICPADKKMYALRDVTATVESIPLICGSIMSKKLAEGAKSLVLDVKYGNGAFMQKYEDALDLALKLQDIGKNAGRNVSAFLTSMDQPLGEWIGNSVEIQECIEILKGENKYSDTLELSLQLSAEMLLITNTVSTFEEGYIKAKDAISSGKAFSKFEEMVALQGGDLNALPKPTKYLEIKSTLSGFVTNFNTKEIGMAGILLKAGREKTNDTINPTAGVRVHKKIGDKVADGDILFTIFSDNTNGFEQASERLLNSVQVSEIKNNFELIKTIIR